MYFNSRNDKNKSNELVEENVLLNIKNVLFFFFLVLDFNFPTCFFFLLLLNNYVKYYESNLDFQSIINKTDLVK